MMGKFKSQIKTVLASMIEYIEENDEPEYTLNEVNECETILNAYVVDLMQNMDDQNGILLCVQTVVESLNELNAKVDCQLIETEQREDLCQFILFSAQSYGLQSDADVTEKWREW